MTTTIAISVDRVLESIYASAAIDTLNNPSARANIVCRDDAPALRHLVRNGAAALIFALTPPVSSSNLSDLRYDGDIITVDIDLPDDVAERLSGSIRPLFESALASHVLGILWTGKDSRLGAMYVSMAADAMESLRRRLSAPGKPGFIAPAA